jgi:hypothetical protein
MISIEARNNQNNNNKLVEKKLYLNEIQFILLNFLLNQNTYRIPKSFKYSLIIILKILFL